MASYRIKENTIKYLERKLKLKVNKEKTEARKANGSKILGFVFRTRGKSFDDGSVKLGRSVPREKSLEKLKTRIREITSRSRGVSLKMVISQLNSLLRGWINYYARSSIKCKIRNLMEWIRRRVRQYAYKIWKTSKNRKHQLRLLGIEEWKIQSLKCSSRSYWKMSKVFGRFIYNKILKEQLGLIDGLELYIEKHEEKKRKDENIQENLFLLRQRHAEIEGNLLNEDDYLFYNYMRFIS